MRPLRAPPDASRLCTLRLGERLLTFTLKRSPRRTIGFVISRSGLTVTAPLRVSIATIEQALSDKQRWIFAKLAAWLDDAAAPDAAEVVWRDGATLPLFGEPVMLRLRQSIGRRSPRPEWDRGANTLTLHVADPDDPASVAAPLRQWLQHQARERFAERLAMHAPRVGVRFNRFALSSAATRWGSCSSTGNIRLNWRLVHCSLTLIDYVVIHELAHLREMNHSPRFWAIVEAMMPDYKLARAALKHPAPGAIPLI